MSIEENKDVEQEKYLRKLLLNRINYQKRKDEGRNKQTVSPEQQKKRGRKPKIVNDGETKIKKPRGRPKKDIVVITKKKSGHPTTKYNNTNG